VDGSYASSEHHSRNSSQVVAELQCRPGVGHKKEIL
jgi:hypothetical protein